MLARLTVCSLLRSIPLCDSITPGMSILLRTLGCCQFLVLRRSFSRAFGGHEHSLLLDSYTRVELSGDKGDTSLAWGDTASFPTAILHPTSDVGGFQVLHSLTTAWCCQALLFATPVGSETQV